MYYNLYLPVHTALNSLLEPEDLEYCPWKPEVCLACFLNQDGINCLWFGSGQDSLQHTLVNTVYNDNVAYW